MLLVGSHVVAIATASKKAERRQAIDFMARPTG
jgi:hypothetical protein